MEFDRSKWPIFTCEALFEPPTIGGSSSPGSSDKLSSTHSMVSFPMMMNPEVRTDRFVVGTWAAACVACVNRTRQLANQRAAVCSHRRESSCLRWVSASARCSCLPPSRCSNRPPRCRSRTSRFVRGREREGERERDSCTYGGYARYTCSIGQREPCRHCRGRCDSAMARGQGGGGAGDPSHDAVTGGTVSTATLAHDLPRRDVVMRSCDCEWWSGGCVAFLFVCTVS